VALAEVPFGGPAQRAGLQAHDVIVAVNDRPIRENDDLFLLVSTQLAGNPVRIDVLRQGQRRRFTVKLAKFPVPGTPIASHRERPRAGLRVDYTSVIGLQLRAIPEGVVIRDVEPNSPADRARLRPDTIIKRVNGRPVFTPAEFYEAMDQSAGPVELVYVSPDRLEERVVLNGTGR
jgi:serine protease Do